MQRLFDAAVFKSSESFSAVEGLAARILTGTKWNSVCIRLPGDVRTMRLGTVVENQFFGKRYGMYQVDGIETLSDFRLFGNEENVQVNCKHHQILAVGEAFGQEERSRWHFYPSRMVSPCCIWQKRADMGPSWMSTAEIFERVCIFSETMSEAHK